MRKIVSDLELTEEVCRIMGADAFGSGDVSVSLKSGCDHIKCIDGMGIFKVAAVLSAQGFGGRKNLLEALDAAALKAKNHCGCEGVLKICMTGSAVLACSDNDGFMRFEKGMDIIFAGECE